MVSCFIGMITTKPLFFILIVIGIVIPVYLVTDHIINYETWGANENYFNKNFLGYKVTCDKNYFAEPTNCMVIDEDGIKVPNETILSLTPKNGCYYKENGNVLPCRMK